MDRLRLCCRPGCGREITACMGTVKGGDYEEAVLGKRHWMKVRELCDRCATRAVLISEISPAMHIAWFNVIGYGQRQLPAPKPAG